MRCAPRQQASRKVSGVVFRLEISICVADAPVLTTMVLLLPLPLLPMRWSCILVASLSVLFPRTKNAGRSLQILMKDYLEATAGDKELCPDVVSKTRRAS